MEFAVSWFLLDSPVKWGGPGVKSVPINTQSLGFLQFHTLTTFCWPGAPTLVSEATLRDRIRSRVPHVPRPAAASLSTAPPPKSRLHDRIGSSILLHLQPPALLEDRGRRKTGNGVAATAGKRNVL